MSLRLAMIAFSLIILAIFLILFIRGVNRKKQDEDVKNVIDILSSETDKRYSISTTRFEHYLIDKVKLSSERVRAFVYTLRVLIVCLFILSYVMFGVIGITVCVAAGILVVMENSKKDEIERSGITRIGDTVAFMDFFTPQIASGTSAFQAFIKYIEKLEPENEYKALLAEYLDAKKNGDYSYKTPDTIRDIVSVYENALYNEEIGADNYLYIIQEAKADLFQKSVYYADYNSKVGEVLKPIESAYVVGVPLIIFLLFGTVGDFWFTIYGIITAVVLVGLFYAFKALCNRLAIKTLHQILG